MARKVHQNGKKIAYPWRPSPIPVLKGWILEWRMKVRLPPEIEDFHFSTYLIFTVWSVGLPRPIPVIAFDNVQRTEKNLQISGHFCGRFSKKMMNKKNRSIHWLIDTWSTKKKINLSSIWGRNMFLSVKEKYLYNSLSKLSISLDFLCQNLHILKKQ